mgnify:FL=1
MRNIVKILTVVVLVTFAFTANAQKLGHLDFAKLYSLMPGQDSIKAVYETYAKGLQNQLATMQAEWENKLTDYQANQATMSNIIKQTKERELQDLQTRMEDFNQKAQQDLSDKEMELTQPLIDKARKAVEDVAKEKGYTYVFNSTEGLLLYAGGEDLMPLVKAKLKIQ